MNVVKKKKKMEILSESNVAEKRKKKRASKSSIFKLHGIGSIEEIFPRAMRGEPARKMADFGGRESNGISISKDKHPEMEKLDRSKERDSSLSLSISRDLCNVLRENPSLSCFLTFPPGQ